MKNIRYQKQLQQIWKKLGQIELMKSSTPALSSTELAHNRTKTKNLHLGKGNYNLRYPVISGDNSLLLKHWTLCTALWLQEFISHVNLIVNPYLAYHFLSVKKKKRRRRFNNWRNFSINITKLSLSLLVTMCYGHAGKFKVTLKIFECIQ